MIIIVYNRFFSFLISFVKYQRNVDDLRLRVQDLFPINSCNFNPFPHELQPASGCNAYEHVKNKLGQSIYLFLDA